MTGRDFEAVLVEQFRNYRTQGVASISRYGVQAIHRGKDDIVTMASLPDFEGLASGIATQVIFDAKVCSQASFNLSPYRKEVKSSNKERQLRHMLERSQFGAVCGFLIHWNARQLKTRSEPAATFWFPVSTSQFWDEFQRGELARISRDDCHELGLEVEWGCDSRRQRKARPQVLQVLKTAWERNQ